MAKAVVTNRAGYRWTDPDTGAVQEADYGQTIDVSSEEVERGKHLGYLDTPTSSAGKAARSDAEGGAVFSPTGGPSLEGAPGAMTEEELAKLKGDDLRNHAAAAGITDVEDMSDDELRAAIQAAGAISTGPQTPTP